jgi:hypothetical protein
MRHIGKTWELHKLLIPTLFMLRARCAPSIQPGKAPMLGVTRTIILLILVLTPAPT